MSPSVSTTNTWSAGSITGVNNYLPGKINANCLVACAGGGGGTPPTAGFTVNPTTACINQTITLTNTSTGSPTSYSWSMPGGTPASSTATNPTVSYATPGSKTISLTATNASGSNTTTQTVTVIAAPTATFTYSVNGTTVSFTYTGSGATSWTWNFGNGNTSTVANPVHTFANSGTFTVTLVVNGPCGTAQSNQTVITAPNANFSANPTTGCAPLTVNFTNLTTGATSYLWTFTGGTPNQSTAVNPLVTYSTPGTYDVTLIATNASGSNSETKFGYIVVGGAPTSSFDANPVGTFVTFTNTSMGATSYSWNFGDGNTSTQASPTHTYASQGTYTVTLIATNNCGSVTSTQTLQIFNAPVASFTFNPASGCYPLVVNYQSTSSGANLAYSWQFPGGTPASSDLPSPTVTYNSPGTYSATLVVSNPSGSNTTSTNNSIQVNGPPATAFALSQQGATVQFTNTTIGGNSFVWDFGNGATSTQTNPTYTYTQDGTYIVTLISTNACGPAGYSETVTVVSPPAAAISASQSTGCTPFAVQFSGQSSPGVTYSWSFPGGTPATSSAQNPSVTYNTAGAFTATLTVSNAAGTASAQQTITVGSGTTPGFNFSTSGLTANFNNTSANATTYLWEFGDGNTSTAVSPSYTYAQDGAYTVTLNATNACGTNTTTLTVVIATPPSAGFATSATTGCTPFNVQFTNQSSSNAANINWTFSGGSITSSTSPNPSVTFSTPGTYTATLTVSNSAGSNTSTQNITVGAGASPGFTQSVLGAIASFTNTSSGANSYAWAFGDGQTSTQASPTHTYAQDGTYTVTLTANNACGGSTTTQTVVIVTPPSANFATSSTNGCSPFTVQFNNQSSANATGYAWTFAGGNPATSTDPNPVVVYATPGTYSVVLTTSNAAGSDTETKSNYITVGTTPVPQFTSAVSGLAVNFTNTSTFANGYTWAFGDGQTSTSASPSHTYAQDGVYTVTMTASNACGNSTSTQTIVIVTPPSANFTSTTTSGCAPLTVQYTNQSSANATGFAWTFEGGTPATSTDPNPVVAYMAPGNYGVSLTSSNAAGSATQTKQNFVQVSTIPTADFIPVSLGANANFQNQSTNATSYLWDFGDGQTSTDLNATHQYANDGFYTVVLTATNPCGSTSTSQVINIVLPPTASFTMSGQSGCAPYNVAFTNASSANATTYAWVFEGGTPATSNIPNPLVVWNTGGLYTVSLTVTNATGSDTYSQFVTVNTLPVSGFTVTQGGLEIGLTNTTVGATSYAWSLGDGGVSTLANPTHTYAVAGTYTVILTATNGCGSVTSEQTVTISGTAPTPAYSASSNIGCAPQTIEFQDASIGDPTSWSWTFVGGTPSSSTSPNPVVVYNQTGNFDISLTVTNPFGTQTQTWQQAIAIGQSPSASFSYTTQNGTVTFINASTAGAQLTWSFGDGTTSTDLNPVHTYSTPGTYIVTLNASNDCGSAVLQQTLNLSFVDVQTPAWINRLVVMPNPASTRFEVQLEAAPQTELQMQLFDVLGREITRKVADFGTGFSQTTWDATDLSPATYFLRISNGKESVVVPVAIVK